MDEQGHVGRFFYEAALSAGYEVKIANVGDAMIGNAILRRLIWFIFKRPISLNQFSLDVLSIVIEWKPCVVITTGLCPLNARTVERIRKNESKIINYSTDDPWNPALRSSWFLRTIPEYDHIFSTRRSNMKNFKQSGCRGVSWLPFAYHPPIHYHVKGDLSEWKSDIAFVGGADTDRVPVIAALILQGYTLSLWGGYWDRFQETKKAARGMADVEALRKVLSGTACALTLVRRANRDGHAMRTYEVAAIGAPSLAEDTEEHREILGEEGITALYFKNDRELMEKCQWLVKHREESSALGSRLRARIMSGQNTYGDRLKEMVSFAENLS